MTLTHWNQKPFTCKAFSQTFHPMSYNYIDYMNAWYNMSYLQSYQHSWFIQFSRGFWSTRLHISSWNLRKIQLLQEQDFISIYHSIETPSWILTWNIIKKQEQPPHFPLYLSREFSIKWWDKFNHEFMCQQKIF